jgi:hypothetical protein
LTTCLLEVRKWGAAAAALFALGELLGCPVVVQAKASRVRT